MESKVVHSYYSNHIYQSVARNVKWTDSFRQNVALNAEYTTRVYLGPLFFLLYINDLPECLHKTKPRLFADDTNITATGKTVAKWSWNCSKLRFRKPSEMVNGKQTKSKCNKNWIYTNWFESIPKKKNSLIINQILLLKTNQLSKFLKAKLSA